MFLLFVQTQLGFGCCANQKVHLRTLSLKVRIGRKKLWPNPFFEDADHFALAET